MQKFFYTLMVGVLFLSTPFFVFADEAVNTISGGTYLLINAVDSGNGFDFCNGGNVLQNSINQGSLWAASQFYGITSGITLEDVALEGSSCDGSSITYSGLGVNAAGYWTGADPLGGAPNTGVGFSLMSGSSSLAAAATLGTDVSTSFDSVFLITMLALSLPVAFYVIVNIIELFEKPPKRRR